jgi:hypothetical protein
MSGMPQVSRRIVNEKQQLINPSSFGAVPSTARPGEVAPEPRVTAGLNRNTHEVNTAFCVESNATLPYF